MEYYYYVLQFTGVYHVRVRIFVHVYMFIYLDLHVVPDTGKLFLVLGNFILVLHLVA